MGVFKNGVGRPSNETIKKRNIFKVICVLLVLVIIVFIGYMLNDKNKKTVNKKDNTVKSVSKKQSKIDNTVKNVSKKDNMFKNESEIVKEIYSYYDNFTYAPPLDEFYTDKGALQENLPENYMVTIATSNLKKKSCVGKYNDYSEDCYSGEEIKNMVAKLFDYNVTFEDDTTISVDCNLYNYSSKNNEFYDSTGGLGTVIDYVKAMYDYNLEDDKLYIYEVVGEYDFSADAYNLSSGEQVSGKLTTDNLLKNKDSFNKYKWTFQKNDKGNYVYKNVEKINDN